MGPSIPDYPEGAPDFLGGDLARPSPYAKSGYWRRYQGFGRPESIPPECDPESVLAFCYSSTPVRPFRSNWAQSWPWIADVLPSVLRNRSFVGTSDGALYVDHLGRDLAYVEGERPEYAVLLE